VYGDLGMDGIKDEEEQNRKERPSTAPGYERERERERGKE